MGGGEDEWVWAVQVFCMRVLIKSLGSQWLLQEAFLWWASVLRSAMFSFLASMFWLFSCHLHVSPLSRHGGGCHFGAMLKDAAGSCWNIKMHEELYTDLFQKAPVCFIVGQFSYRDTATLCFSPSRNL